MKANVSILYVDDEPINLMLFESYFRQKYSVVTANSGSEALELLKNNDSINIVISDMKMPEMNGVEFVTLAKKEYPGIQYFILSGFEVTNTVETALSEKIILAYFTKPVNMKQLEDSILNYMCDI